MEIPKNNPLSDECCDCFYASAANLQKPFIAAAVITFALLSQESAADELANVRLRLVNGSSIRATIDSIDEDGRIAGSRILNNVSLDEIVSLETGRKSVDIGAASIVQLNPSGRLPFSKLKIENETVEIGVGGETRSLPLELIRAVVWKGGPKVASAIAESSTDRDSVVVQTGRGNRIVRGLVESVDATHVNIYYDGESRRILLNKVKAIVPAKLAVTSPRGVAASIRLIDGSSVVGALRSFRENEFRIALTENHEITLSADKVVRIEIESDRIAWLSDLEPIRVQQQTQFVAARPWRRDKSLLGNPIRLKFNSSSKIHEFEKGIGARSYTALIFKNSKNYSHFRSVVGIDVETEGYGDCEMVVEGDGIRLWSRRVRATDDPESVKVDITGIEEVALIVLPGKNFDLADHADWADARFTRSD